MEPSLLAEARLSLGALHRQQKNNCFNVEEKCVRQQLLQHFQQQAMTMFGLLE